MECAAKADDPSITPAERKRLLKMREALLELANAQDWLDERKKPPTQQQQQRQPKKSRPRIGRAGLARRSQTAIARQRKRAP
jgi:hypothetical protein